MTNKEKEKAYDEALERAKKYYSTTNSAADTELIELIFPELKGSDDEKVRKALIDYFKRYDMCWTETFNGVPTDKILAWLEKQGEQKASYTTTVEIGNGGINALVTGELSNSCDYEEKPADKVKPKCEESKTKIFDAPTPFEDKLYAFVAACEFLAIPSKIEFILEHSQEILDAAREQIGKEQSSAWSEEDELVVEDIEEAVINYWHGQSQEDLLDWLKSLKTKVQPKQEWSEKDEEELEIAIDTLKESGRYDSAKWVQSLKRRIGGKL